jgi:ATP-binding cassette, subfamily B, bacterial
VPELRAADKGVSRKKNQMTTSRRPVTLTAMPLVTLPLVTRAPARGRPVGALWRLRGYLKPFRLQMIIMLAAALGAVAAAIAIPLLTKAVIDGAIAHGARRLLIPLALAAGGLGTVEALPT